MNATPESTAIDDQWRRRRLGPDLFHRTIVILDERDSLVIERDSLKAKAALHTEHMRAKRTLKKITLVERAIAEIKPALDRQHICFWSAMIRDQIHNKAEFYGLNVVVIDGIRHVKDLPSLRRIKLILQSLGYSY